MLLILIIIMGKQSQKSSVHYLSIQHWVIFLPHQKVNKPATGTINGKKTETQQCSYETGQLSCYAD
jgi:hypothetical protein